MNRKIIFFSSKTSQGCRYGVGGLGGGSIASTIAYNLVELYNERKREAHCAKPQSLSPISRPRPRPSRPGTRLRGPARHALEMRADRLCPATVMAAIGVARMHRPRPRRQALCRLKSEVRGPHTIMVSDPVIPSAAQATRSAACRWLHARAAPTADRPRSRGPSTHSGSPLRRAR